MFRAIGLMTTPHLGPRGVHPVVASSAREVLNKSENERSGLLSSRRSRYPTRVTQRGRSR